jgi:hypothetical protein
MARSCNSRALALIDAAPGRCGGLEDDSRADAAVALQGLRVAGGAPARTVPRRPAR